MVFIRYGAKNIVKCRRELCEHADIRSRRYIAGQEDNVIIGKVDPDGEELERFVGGNRYRGNIKSRADCDKDPATTSIRVALAAVFTKEDVILSEDLQVIDICAKPSLRQADNIMG